MIFFDTNVLVYALDPTEPAKRMAARRVLREAAASGSIVLSTQVLQEFYATMLRRRFLSQGDAAEAVRAWADNQVVSITPELVLQAVELHQRRQLSFWDALVVRSALDRQCAFLYTEDLQHGQTIDGLEIVNPFLREAHEPGPEYLQATTPGSVDQVLRGAIAARRLISFRYEGRPKEGEPHDYGLIGGHPRLNFFQTRGRSRNGLEEAGKWKTLDPAKMSQLRMLDQSFGGTRPTGRGLHKHWDQLIATVTPR